MPDISTIVVPDAATTPVNHTFNKLKVNGDAALFLEQSNASSLGYWPLAISLRAPVAGQVQKMHRATVELSIPVVTTETVNGVGRPKLEYTMRFKGEFAIPAEATLQNRKDLRKISVGILNDAAVVGIVESLLNVT